jgi:hypothetical protein
MRLHVDCFLIDSSLGLFMIDAGYVSFSGEGSDEDIGVTALRLIGLIVGLLFLVLPLNILVSKQKL